MLSHEPRDVPLPEALPGWRGLHEIGELPVDRVEDLDPGAVVEQAAEPLRVVLARRPEEAGPPRAVRGLSRLSRLCRTRR